MRIQKTIRFKLGGENCYYPQCMNVPEKLGRKYFMHPEWYKKIIYARAWKRKSGDKNLSFKRLKTSKNDETDNGLFPSHSIICKCISIKVNAKNQLAKYILSYITDSRIEEASGKRNSEKMLTDIN